MFALKKNFNGEIAAPPEYPMEHAQRGGHIPGAKNIPWIQAINEDGTFKTLKNWNLCMEIMELLLINI